MEFNDYLNKTRKEIENELFRQLDLWIKETGSSNLLLAPYLNTFVTACRGGKRLRGVLIKLGFDMADGNNPEIYKVAAAYEIFQTAILIHDDLIDKSKERRGIPSVYASFGTDHHGLSQAICLGDLGNFLAIKLLSETDFPADLKGKAVLLMSRIMHDTVLGQMGDIDGAKNRNLLTEKDIFDIYYQKTAKYSFIGPLQIGGVLGGLSSQNLAKLGVIGKYLGVAFQLHDDNLTVGEKEDIIEGKATLIYQYAYNHAGNKQKQYLEKYYGKEKITSKNIDEIIKIFISTGALAYAKEKATSYLNQARKEMTALNVNERAKDLLMQYG